MVLVQIIDQDVSINDESWKWWKKVGRTCDYSILNNSSYFKFHLFFHLCLNKCQDSKETILLQQFFFIFENLLFNCDKQPGRLWNTKLSLYFSFKSGRNLFEKILFPPSDVNLILKSLCGGGVAGRTSRNARDSLGVRKRAQGQRDDGFREGLVWQEEGAAGTGTPPPPHHQHHQHHQHRRRRSNIRSRASTRREPWWFR